LLIFDPYSLILQLPKNVFIAFFNNGCMIGAAIVSGLIIKHEAAFGAAGQQTKEKVQTGHATAG